MAYKCELCKKGIMIGKQHTHHRGVAGGRWLKRAPKTQKIFKPNLHAAHILVNGMRQKVRLCTKCLRRTKAASDTVKEEQKIPVKVETPGIPLTA